MLLFVQSVIININKSGALVLFSHFLSFFFSFFRYVGGSRRELSGVKELVTSRRVQKRPSANVVRSDGGCIGGSPGSGGVIAGGLLGGCSGGSDALAELTIEDLASIPAGNHTSANHTGHSSHHKVSELG